MSVDDLERFVLFDPSMFGAKRHRRRRRTLGGSECACGATELERILGVKVPIRDRKGKGKITLEYSTIEDTQDLSNA